MGPVGDAARAEADDRVKLASSGQPERSRGQFERAGHVDERHVPVADAGSQQRRAGTGEHAQGRGDPPCRYAVAVLGSGFDPGVTNMYCAHAQKHLFTVADRLRARLEAERLL